SALHYPKYSLVQAKLVIDAESGTILEVLSPVKTLDEYDDLDEARDCFKQHMDADRELVMFHDHSLDLALKNPISGTLGEQIECDCLWIEVDNLIGD
ncbi:MAG: hypothetical protein V4583_16365, partial [Pseudomonadota bacterium]